MKADEIKKGMKVGVVRAGKGRPLQYTGIVTDVFAKSYGSRVQTYAAIHRHDEHGRPMDLREYRIGEGQVVIEGEPWISNVRIQEVISEEQVREKNAQMMAEETHRRMVRDMKDEAISKVLAKLGLDREDCGQIYTVPVKENGHLVSHKVNFLSLNEQGIEKLASR